MIECFPPIPIYVVTGIVATMFTTVVSKIESDEPSGTDPVFAWFLLFLLMTLFAQLLSVLLPAAIYGECRAGTVVQVNSDARWLLGFHVATLFPLPLGIAIWFWLRLEAVRLEGDDQDSPPPAAPSPSPAPSEPRPSD